MHDHRERHQEAAYQIVRYLKGCPGRDLLFFRHGHLKIEGYTDADWARALDDRKSTSDYYTFLDGNLMTWHSKKQDVVARSSAEVEYRALAQRHDWTKHIEVDRHFIKEKLDQYVICLPFIKSSEQLADIYTKGLSTSVFTFIYNKMGLHDIFAPS
ncbi:secreted RxLR effector protein 161-like [Elaeis guineensis]|uniref:secreted RxLR effector protein 161-like n=1 Tax=Elaeis guineensis var. tenera TaxID=51953 RepID=UPI003C6D1B46